MTVRRLPVRPDLQQLRRQARELLRAIHAGDARAVAELRERHPARVDSTTARLADARRTLARSYDLRMLRDMGATDLESAAGRPALQGHPDTVRMIHELADRPSLEHWSLERGMVRRPM